MYENSQYCRTTIAMVKFFLYCAYILYVKTVSMMIFNCNKFPYSRDVTMLLNEISLRSGFNKEIGSAVSFLF